MASAFWTFEDGRSFARRWWSMTYMLELITTELKEMKGAEAFYEYLDEFVCREENGDFGNGYGGFIRGNESIMFNLDLRTFAPQNRVFFWQAAQEALRKLKIKDDEQYQGIIALMTELMDMHKRIMKGEDAMLLNHSNIVEPDPNEKLGPGW